MKPYEERLIQKLNDLRNRSRFRELKPQHSGDHDFTSNDYLGLGRSTELWSWIAESYKELPEKRNGSGGSRLLSGNSTLAENVEHQLTSVFRSAATLLFTSGYTANTGILSCIPGRDDTIIYDEHAHACIKEGARLSLAKRFSFRHNDLEDLKKKISKCEGTVFIVVESIYSMDGDLCPLEELTSLTDNDKCVLVLDEAHSTGVLGAGGGGLAVAMGLETKVDIRVMTFGKAMGVHGACVACDRHIKEFLVNFSLPFVYTTAPSPHEVMAISSAFRWLRENLHLQELLHRKIAVFKRACLRETGSLSAIQPILIPGNEQARKASHDLQAKGFDVRAVLSPTVRSGTERLRICLHTFNDDDQIQKLALELNQL